MIPARSDLIEEIWTELDQLRLRKFQSFCSEPLPDISLPQLHLLVWLRDRGASTISDLAHGLKLSLPSASSILDRMEERELIRRTRPEHDRRVVMVDITGRGRQVADELIGFSKERTLRILDAMTEEELASVAAGFRAVHSAMRRLGPDSLFGAGIVAAS